MRVCLTLTLISSSVAWAGVGTRARTRTRLQAAWRAALYSGTGGEGGPLAGAAGGAGALRRAGPCGRCGLGSLLGRRALTSLVAFICSTEELTTMPASSRLGASSITSSTWHEMRGDVGRCGEMWGDVGRCGEIWSGTQPKYCCTSALPWRT